jgi:hypothetical protein
LCRVAFVLVDDDVLDALILLYVCSYLVREISILAKQLGSAFQIQPISMTGNDVDDHLVGDQVFHVSLVSSSTGKEDIGKGSTLNCAF